MTSIHQFNGEETFSVSSEKLWQFLTDIHNVPLCLPNLKEAQFPSSDSLSGKLMSSFSFLSGSLGLTIQITDRIEPVSAKMVVNVRGMGCRALINGSIEFPEPGAGLTILRWRAEAQLDGLLAAVSKGLIEGVARKLITDTFQTVRTLVAQSV